MIPGATAISAKPSKIGRLPNRPATKPCHDCPKPYDLHEIVQLLLGHSLPIFGPSRVPSTQTREPALASGKPKAPTLSSRTSQDSDNNAPLEKLRLTQYVDAHYAFRLLPHTPHPKCVMAKEDSDHFAEKAIESAAEFIKQHIGDSRTPRGYLALAAALLIASYLFLWLLSKYAEFTHKIISTFRTLPLFGALTSEERVQRRRRAQFCKVMRSDIEALNKTENWNDQHFTELEAEVEADGYYYPSRLHRLLRYRSFGIRRVRSLIGAIASSAESALLVVGEPGSGKGVAMRHLAIALAQRGSRLRAANAPVPLYINLKELPEAPTTGPTPALIHQFVLTTYVAVMRIPLHFCSRTGMPMPPKAFGTLFSTHSTTFPRCCMPQVAVPLFAITQKQFVGS